MTVTASSSVAKREVGGLELPHWPKKYAKYHIFSAFEADFCSKYENSPTLPMGWAIRSCEGLAVIWTRKGEFFLAALNVGQKK